MITNKVLPSVVRQAVRNVGESFCICWSSKRKLFQSALLTPIVSRVCPPCPMTAADTRPWLLSWVEKSYSDSKINLSIARHRHSHSFPTCLWASAVCLGAAPWKAFTEGEKERGCRGHFKKKKKVGEGNPTKTAKRKKNKTACLHQVFPTTFFIRGSLSIN